MNKRNFQCWMNVFAMALVVLFFAASWIPQAMSEAQQEANRAWTVLK